MGWFKRPTRPAVEKTVNSIIKTGFIKIIDEMIPKMMRDSLNRDPNAVLTSVGFQWALILAFEDAWPDIDHKTAISCARDCLEVPYGTSGYDWSASAAQELVRDYVSTHGEAS